MNRRELLAAAVAVPVLGGSPAEPTCAELLRRFRRQAGLTINQAAKRAGLTVADWRQWEAGTKEPFASECVAICRALGITMNRFLGIAA